MFKFVTKHITNYPSLKEQLYFVKKKMTSSSGFESVISWIEAWIMHWMHCRACPL